MALAKDLIGIANAQSAHFAAIYSRSGAQVARW
jgi:hypothetical protein